MKSIHLVFTILLLMVSIAGFGNSTAHLDKNYNADTVEFSQLDMKSVEAEVFSLDFNQLEMTSVDSVIDAIKFESSENHKTLKHLFFETFKYDNQNLSLQKDNLKAHQNHKTFLLTIQSERRNGFSLKNYNLKTGQYSFKFIPWTYKSNRIRFLC